MGSDDSRAQIHHVFRQLGGWPLPTMADSDTLHATRTKAFSAVGVRKHWKKDCNNLFSSVSNNTIKGIGLIWRF
jgi:hypothetical protein